MFHLLRRQLPAQLFALASASSRYGVAGTFPLPACGSGLIQQQMSQTIRTTSEDDEHDKANAGHILWARQPDECATEQRMDQRLVGYRQKYSEAEVDCLRLGTLVPVCNVGDRTGTTTHDSRLRWLSA